MSEKRLIGSDGKLITVTLGDELVGNGTSTLDVLVDEGEGGGAGWYTITGISDGITAFDSDLSINDLFWDDGSMVLDDGTLAPDKVIKLEEKEMTDIESFNFELSKAEIDVTTLSDGIKRYRAGKTDMTGSMEGITTLGATDEAGYVINSFLRIIKQAADGTATVDEVDGSPIYLKGYVNGNVGAGEVEGFVWCKVNLLSTSLGASGEDKQSFSSSFRIAPGNPVPTLYLREIPEPEEE